MSKVNQLKNKARREEQRENWSRAIELYTQALDASRQRGEAFADLSLYNRIGDIYLRIGQKNTAVRYYEQAIDRYADQDLHTSAIALCNKVLRILPERSTVYLQLGRLNLATNLVAEARQHYHRYARAMRDRGGAAAAYEALEELIERTGDARTLTLWVGWLAEESDPNVAVERVEGARVALEDQGVDPDDVIEKIRTGDVTELEVARSEVAEEDPLAGAFLSVPDAYGKPKDAARDAPAAAAGEPADGDAPDDALAAVMGELGVADAPEAGAPEQEAEAPSLPLLSPLGSDPEAARATDPVPTDGEDDATDAATPPAHEADERADAILEAMGSVTGELELGSVPWEDEFGETSAAAIGRPPAPEPGVASDDAERSLGAEDGDTPTGAARTPESLETSDDWVDEVAAPPASYEGAEAGEGEVTAETALPFAEEREDARAEGADDGTVLETAPEASEDERSDGRLASTHGSALAAEGGEFDGPTSIVATAMPLAEDLEASLSDPDAAFGVDTPFELEVAGGEGGIDVSLDAPTARAADLEDPSERLEPDGAEDWLDADREDSEGDDGPMDPEDLAAAVSGEGAETRVVGGELEGPEVDEIEVEAVEALVSDAQMAAEAGATRDREETGIAVPASPGEPDFPALDAVEASSPTPAPVLEDAEPDVGAEPDVTAARETIAELDAGAEPDVEADPAPSSDAELRAAIEAETIAYEVPAARDASPALATEADEPSEVAEPMEPAELDDRVVEPVVPPSPEAPDPLESETASVVSEASAPDGDLEVAPEVARSPEASDADAGPAGEEARVDATEDEVTGPLAEPRLKRIEEDPEDAFRDWVSSASMGVLRRALPELEGRNEREKALLVIRRLSLIEEPEVEFKRRLVDALTDLGRTGEAVEACVNLALALEDLGRPIEARGAYARVLGLAPEDPRALDGLERLEDAKTTETPQPEADEATRPYSPPHVSTRDTSMIATHPAPTNGTPTTIVPDYPVPGSRDDGPQAGRPAPYAGVAGGVEAGSDFEQLLSEFRAELHEKPRRSDSSSRTEVGATLKEMGRLDDAIRELQAAVREPSPPPLAYELLGEAFLEKGQSRIAVRLLEKALATLGQTDREMLGVLYQLGVCYERLNEAPKALLCYERIFSVDIDYRDVQDRILHCSSM